MGLPQIIFLVLVALLWVTRIFQLGGKISHNGSSKNQILVSIFVYPTVWIGLTYWGGFYNG